MATSRLRKIVHWRRRRREDAELAAELDAIYAKFAAELDAIVAKVEFFDFRMDPPPGETTP